MMNTKHRRKKSLRIETNRLLARHVNVGILLRLRRLPHLQLKLITRVIAPGILLLPLLATKGQGEGVSPGLGLAVDGSGCCCALGLLCSVCRGAGGSRVGERLAAESGLVDGLCLFEGDGFGGDVF